MKSSFTDYVLDILSWHTDSPPHCSACQTQLAVEHVLLRCPTWNAIRVNHFTVTSLLDLFNQVASLHLRCIVDFIKEIGFHRRIWSSSFMFIVFMSVQFYIPRLQFLHLSFLRQYHFWIPCRFLAVGLYIQHYQFWSILGTDSPLIPSRYHLH